MYDTRNSFLASGQKKFNSLLDRNVFNIVPSLQSIVHRVFNSRFVDSVKHEGTPHAFNKSKLVEKAFNDLKHGLLTHAPIVWHRSRFLLLSLCSVDPPLYFLLAIYSRPMGSLKNAFSVPYLCTLLLN